ncbi:MAG: signal peptidase II [Clostridia bacterium]|nr:signal peptidase II [Clostridia bacterium]
MFILISVILLLALTAYLTLDFSLNKSYAKSAVYNSLGAMVCMIVLDRIVKYWTLKEVAAQDGGIELIEGAFRFSYVENRGAAFGILQNQRWLFIAATLILIIVGLLLLYKARPQQPFIKAAILMIAAGGIGNLIDRVFMGYVIDTFDFYLINFAVFNVADSFVCVGAFALIIGILLTPDKKKTKTDETDNA